MFRLLLEGNASIVSTSILDSLRLAKEKWNATHEGKDYPEEYWSRNWFQFRDYFSQKVTMIAPMIPGPRQNCIHSCVYLSDVLSSTPKTPLKQMQMRDLVFRMRLWCSCGKGERKASTAFSRRLRIMRFLSLVSWFLSLAFVRPGLPWDSKRSCKGFQWFRNPMSALLTIIILLVF